jgi:hypothetical protein
MEFPSLILTISELTKLGRGPCGPLVSLQKRGLSFGLIRLSFRRVLPEALVISIPPSWVSCIRTISMLLSRC